MIKRATHTQQPKKKKDKQSTVPANNSFVCNKNVGKRTNFGHHWLEKLKKHSKSISASLENSKDMQ